MKEHFRKYEAYYRLILIGLLVSFIVGTSMVYALNSRDEVYITPASVQALCIHLNEKWRKEGLDWHIEMKDCKARKPLDAATKWVKDN